MSVKDKWVRRFSVDETAKHKNGFTIYKITSVLFPIESPEALTVVSVWKRHRDVQRLHRSMRLLHAGLHLRGTFPPLASSSFFKRFQQGVIKERAKTIKALLEFIADHKLLFTSTDFVNFLQSGYPEPESSDCGVINAIRSSLQLPAEDTPPLEYHNSDDDTGASAHPEPSTDEIDSISQIPVYEAANVERCTSPKHQISKSSSYESLNSLDSINSDLYSELEKVTICNSRPSVKKAVLPDLINFDVPSTSKFDDYHTMPRANSDNTSLSSTVEAEDRSNSRVSVCRSVVSLSNVECKTKTEDSYVFEAGYMLNLAARYEDMREYQRAFECYKAGIEKMLIGVQSDTDPQRRTLIKEKTNKYLSYAESIYKNHLCDVEQSLLPDREETIRAAHCPIPLSMLSRPYEELAQYRVLAVLGPSVMLVLHRGEQACYAMKVIQKVPNNLTEFDEYFLQNTNETRQPILPTLIPYMVPLHSYIQTNNLIFLILSYAPGEKLFDYIRNYSKSNPNTPAREVNLENVFTEPKIRRNDIENDNIDSIIEIKNLDVDLKIEASRKDDSDINILERLEANVENNNEVATGVLEKEEVSVNELVKNSQKLLLNVDRVLTEVPKLNEVCDVVEIEKDTDRDAVQTPIGEKRVEIPAGNLPAGAVRRWGAELLAALRALHGAGLVCRDLNPSNILLGDQGQIILTYFSSYPGVDMCLSKLRAKPANMYIAPELYENVYVEERDEGLDKVCDFWSFGAIMYELLCGVPLSEYHRSIFTSHTLLHLPDGLPVEVQSLLTQLLTYSPAERLGAGGVEEIQRHPYFRRVDWDHVVHSWAVPT